MTTAVPSSPPAQPAASQPQPSHWRRYGTLYLLITLCVAPVVASYLLYYAAPPSGRTNYGELVPQQPMPPLTLKLQDGTAYDPKQLLGQWVMLHVDGAACADACKNKLWQMRQLRAAQGKNSDRIERVFLVVDAEPLETMLLREYDGTHFLRASRAELERFLQPQPGARLEDHVYMIDPIGNLMMRWPKDADPNRMKRDISRLLKASRIG